MVVLLIHLPTKSTNANIKNLNVTKQKKCLHWVETNAGAKFIHCDGKITKKCAHWRKLDKHFHQKTGIRSFWGGYVLFFLLLVSLSEHG
jgi:hypothetical protein